MKTILFNNYCFSFSCLQFFLNNTYRGLAQGWLPRFLFQIEDIGIREAI